MKDVVIYVLIDPTTDEPFYVGKTESPLNVRLRGHICEARRGDHSASGIIQAILESGARPIIREVERISGGGEWISAEKRWIAHYRTVGSVTNKTTGGQGVSGALRTPEWRAKIVESRRKSGRDVEGAKRAAEKNRGRIHSEEERRKRSASLAGRKMSPEWVAAMIARQAGKARSTETKGKISASKLGTYLTDEHKAKIKTACLAKSQVFSAKQSANWHDKEYRSRMTSSMREREPSTDATRSKLRQSTKAAWADDTKRTDRLNRMSVVMSSDSYKANMKTAIKAKWADPVFRERMALAHATAKAKRLKSRSS